MAKSFPSPATLAVIYLVSALIIISSSGSKALFIVSVNALTDKV